MSFPVAVVRLIISNDQDKVLILKRASSSHSPGAWCLPGGKVDYGETVEQAARKELLEETSLACSSLDFLFYQASLPPGPGDMHCINLYLECTVAGTLRLNEESSDYAWVGPEELPKYEIAFRNEEGILRYWSERDRREAT